jgi:hypothetical protein
VGGKCCEAGRNGEKVGQMARLRLIQKLEQERGETAFYCHSKSNGASLLEARRVLAVEARLLLWFMV